ncbi:hypothetical protein [Saccharicrinis sp. 156]|uniref:hypothetical protein n=1 Tax=Saccharicrinis sp. 156 TaxID=3417574 RepID=UPI003D342A34
MKNHLFTILTLMLLLNVNVVIAQEDDSSRFNLMKAPIDKAARNAVWRTDFYICTGIAYAKSAGRTTDDFMKFVADTHVNTLNSIKGKGLEPIINLANFLITSYPDGTFEIISESPSTVKYKTNRPYISYFTKGYMVGVTIDEFEKCLWGHFKLMLKSLGIDFDYHIEGDFVEAEVTLME